MPSDRPDNLDAAAVVRFHELACTAFFTDHAVQARADAMVHDTPLWRAIAANHANNMHLWAEEDLARRTCASDAEIVANKRAIDRYNQARNDAVERIDDHLIPIVSEEGRRARLNSETPGSMIDRLSIASLKHHHMLLQTGRTDVDARHHAECRARAGRIAEQRADLRDCLTAFLAECAAGKAGFKVYRQFKMYNDAALNMALVHEARAAREARPS